MREKQMVANLRMSDAYALEITHTYINTYIHTHTYIHTYIHTCISAVSTLIRSLEARKKYMCAISPLVNFVNGTY